MQGALQELLEYPDATKMVDKSAPKSVAALSQFNAMQSTLACVHRPIQGLGTLLLWSLSKNVGGLVCLLGGVYMHNKG
jgi:hypothetical protein